MASLTTDDSTTDITTLEKEVQNLKDAALQACADVNETPEKAANLRAQWISLHESLMAKKQDAYNAQVTTLEKKVAAAKRVHQAADDTDANDTDDLYAAYRALKKELKEIRASTLEKEVQSLKDAANLRAQWISREESLHAKKQDSYIAQAATLEKKVAAAKKVHQAADDTDAYDTDDLYAAYRALKKELKEIRALMRPLGVSPGSYMSPTLKTNSICCSYNDW